MRRIGTAAAALALLFATVGLARPARFRIERSVAIAAAAEKVYSLIAAPPQGKHGSAWNLRHPKMPIAYGGPAAGARARRSWRSDSEGNGAMAFVDAVAGQRLTQPLSFPDLGMRSPGKLLIEPPRAGVAGAA